MGGDPRPGQAWPAAGGVLGASCRIEVRPQVIREHESQLAGGSPRDGPKKRTSRATESSTWWT